MSYDSKCYELAEHFLPDDVIEEHKVMLAQLIQQVCEDYLQEMEGK